MSHCFGLKGMQFISLNLRVPTLKLRKLLLKASNALKEFRLLLLAGKLRSNCVCQLDLNLRHCCQEFAVIRQAAGSLDDLQSGLRALNSGGNFSEHDVKPNYK